MGGTIVYAIALLISLAAASGMFMAKRWGKILGIIMAVLYGLLALVSLLPILLISFMGIRNPLNLDPRHCSPSAGSGGHCPCRDPGKEKRCSQHTDCTRRSSHA